MDDREPPPRRDQGAAPPLPAPPAGTVPAVPVPATTERRGRKWLILAGAAVALGVIAVIVALAVGGGEPFRLPDDIGGAARIQEGPFEGFVDSMLEYVTQDVEGAPYAAGAAYGDALDPTHILFVVENPGLPPGATIQQFKAGYDTPGDEILLDRLIEETRDGIRYECAPTSDVTIPTTVCTWQTDRTVGFLISFLSDRPAESMPLVQDARSDVEG
jgi:hypothetical protein